MGRLAALLVGHARPRAVVHTYHGHVLSGYFDSRRERAFRLIERLLAHATGKLIAVSNEVQDDLVGLRVASADRFAVVPYGFDLPAWSDATRRRAAHPRRARRRTGHVRGRLGRPPHADQAAARPDPTLRALLDSGVDAVLVLVGDGDERTETEALAHELGVFDRCRFVGFKQRIREWFAAFDATLLTSTNEGTPVMAIESLAAERPVVATRVGGTATVVEDGESGFLEPLGDTPPWPPALPRSQPRRHSARPGTLRRRSRARTVRDGPDGRRGRRGLPRAPVAMRILHVHKLTGVSGSENHLLALCPLSGRQVSTHASSVSTSPGATRPASMTASTPWTSPTAGCAAAGRQPPDGDRCRPCHP